MEFERETNQIDKEGNFLFENRRVDTTTDAWIQSFEDSEEGKVRKPDVDFNRGCSKGTQRSRSSRQKRSCRTHN